MSQNLSFDFAFWFVGLYQGSSFGPLEFLFVLIRLVVIFTVIVLPLIAIIKLVRKKKRQEIPTPLRAAAAIFISYRRDDAGDVTGRIYDRLAQHFGKPFVFKDVDGIPLGIDFRKHLGDSVGRCDVLLAVIGTRWLLGNVGQR